ncbi:MAG: LPS export ABC transporter permease LptG [Deltaproteobacteria bacterium]|nr:LPS export ABC transporter permease LptG [Deltaproteobacteria bacterium]
MTIITRYIVREFLKIFFLCLGACVGLFFVIDLSVQYLDNFSKYNPPFLLTMLFCLYKIPQMFYWVCPMAMLLAIFLTLALLTKNNEIIAMKAGGISAYTIITPLLIISSCLVLVSFCNQELILPYASQKVEYIENVRIKRKRGKNLLKQNRFWYRSEDIVCNIELFEHASNTLHGVTIYFFDQHFKLKQRLDATRGKWVDNKWHFYDLVIRTFNPDGSMAVENTQEKIIPLKETPDDFKVARREPEEMSYAELKDYINKIERAGYQIPEYIPSLYAKLSFPFICLIMPILAIPFALRIGRGGGIALGIGMSVMMGFIYFVFFNFSLSLGTGGILPPLFSAWVANILFGSLGIYLFLRVRQ